MCFTRPHTDKSIASGYFNQFGNWLNTYTQAIKSTIGKGLTWLYRQVSDKAQANF